MPLDWITIERVAQEFGLTVPEALALAERMHWPRVFRTHETLVLAPSHMNRHESSLT